jgi:cell fate regulator YaaT (PSP1 superfamily)
MGCVSCGSTKDGIPRGCKNNGTCGADGCNKLTVFDWLADMSVSGDKDHRVEVRFKNGRKHFFETPKDLSLTGGDVVVTEVERGGYDVGVVSLTGSLVAVQIQHKKAKGKSFSKVLRKASQHEIDTWSNARDREPEVQKRARELALSLGLAMKLSDVEFQGDGRKATFYYTAEGRVDFRQLIKDMASVFGIRIEMRQIGLREEASRLGGIGSCGRELCCSTWLTDLRAVNTSAARYQQLALNPQKLAGQCGKLKCCLNFELDAYQDALKGFPKTDCKIKTEKGVAVCQKTDIFQGVMWFAYKGEWSVWHKLSSDQARELIQKNKDGVLVESIEAFAEQEDQKHKNSINFENVVGQDSLNRFDQKQNPKKRRSKRRPNQKNKTR